MKKYISAIIINALLIQLAGCYSWETVQTPKPNTTIKIITRDSVEVELSKWNWNETDKYFMYLPEDNKLTERDSAMKWVKVDKNEIISIQEKKFDNTMVYAVIAAGIGLALLTAVLVAFQNWDSL